MKTITLSPAEVELILIDHFRREKQLNVLSVDFHTRTEVIETGIGEFEIEHFDGVSVDVEE